MTLENPTRPTGRSSRSASTTAEAKAWPEHATILSLMGSGLTYEEAFETSPIDSRKYGAIAQAWSIPPDKRDGGVMQGTAKDLARLLG